MKFLFLIIFTFISFKVSASEFKCNFEEVYSNGEIQPGLLLIKKDKLRYEYLKKELFTLLFVNNKIFSIDNRDRKKAHVIEDQNNLINDIMKIYADFPNIKKSYVKNGKVFDIEISKENFIKRLAIKSNSLNLSIYFFDCLRGDIENKYFNFNPLMTASRWTESSLARTAASASMGSMATAASARRASRAATAPPTPTTATTRSA